MKRFLALLPVAVFLITGSVAAETIYLDPATLHIGPGANTPCAMGCGGDPNTIGSMGLDIYQNQGGASFLNNPLLLILAVPNDDGSISFSNSSITSVTSYNPYPGTGISGSASFGLSGGAYGWSGSGYNGSMAADEVFSFLGLDSPHNESNSFVNFAGTEFNQYGITATGFGIYVFALTTEIAGKGLVDVQFSAPLPHGTIAATYGQVIDVKTYNNKPPDITVTIYENPYTEAGTVNHLPEPGSLLLLGSGLLGLGFWRYHRKSR